MIANRMKIEQTITRSRSEIKERLDQKAHGRSLRRTGSFNLLSEDSENTVKARLETFGDAYKTREVNGFMGSESKRRTKRVASWPGLRYALGRESVGDYNVTKDMDNIRMANEDDDDGDENDTADDESRGGYKDEDEYEDEGMGLEDRDETMFAE